MKRLIVIAAFAALFSMNAFAHEAFTLVSSEKKTIKKADLSAAEKTQTIGKQDKTTLTFTEKVVRIVVVTGPPEDMLSFWVQGMRNPTLVVPSDATLKVLFVNTDIDMKHDVRFGHIVGEFKASPSIVGTAGSTKLDLAEDGTMQAEELVIKSAEDGRFKYFCSVGSHAKGGMWGHIVVGVKPGNLQPPAKTTHGHTAREDHVDAKPAGEPAVKQPADSHDQHGAPSGQKTETKQPAKQDEHAGMQHGAMQHGATGTSSMSAVTNIGDPMSRESSGTAWGPDSSPVYAKMKMTDGGGMWMFMGTAFLRYTSVGSTRDLSASGEGDRARVDAPTMFMAMYSHPLGEKAQIGFRGMFSLDPVIQRGYGYPLLYQSGELYRGEPIHDRQHPHDLVSELAVTYSYKFDDKRSFYLYAGLPGEPALGPPMYLHRVSGMNNPDAPISHHWQDATHITYGVVTAGFSFGKAKIEASAFNGTEPNENRWNFDRPRLNSFSGRLSFNPTRNWALQISHGYLRNPEPHEPDIRVLRKTTASAIYNKRIDDERNFAGSFVWGQNHANGERTNAILFEGNYDFYRNAVFGRFETVQKSGHDLVLPHPLDHDVFRVNAGSIGYVRDVMRSDGIDLGLGGMVTINKNPAALMPVYGGTTHGGWQLFMRIRPSKLH